MSSYLLRSGDAGARRLVVLANVHARDTDRFLDGLPLAPAARCLDVGCGIGAVSAQIARRLGPGGSVLGIDIDEHYVAMARERAGAPAASVTFAKRGVEELEGQEGGAYDLVYSRFLLSHLRDPVGALAAMVRAARPGGYVAVEDVDFGGAFCHPPSPDFERYLGWYAALTRSNGGDPNFGRELFAAFVRAGLHDVEVSVVQPVFRAGDGKALVPTTLAHVGDALLEAKIATAEELGATLAALASYVSDPTTLLSMPRIFQVCGRVS